MQKNARNLYVYRLVKDMHAHSWDTVTLRIHCDILAQVMHIPGHSWKALAERAYRIYLSESARVDWISSENH